MSLDLDSIRAAHERIRSHIHRTPVLTSERLDDESGAKLIFKCENFQKTGAFKARGATNAVFSLDDSIAARGVATHSSGNHAAALARAAKLRGIPAHIVMPSTAPKMKVRMVEDYGAHIVFCEPTQEAREAACADVIAKTGATLIHPFENEEVMAGQGTAAVELLEDVDVAGPAFGGQLLQPRDTNVTENASRSSWASQPVDTTGCPPGAQQLDLVLCPVGGGGLLCGTAVAAKSMRPKIKVIGVEPASADDAAQSFRAGRLMRIQKPNTIADGLRMNMGAPNFEIVRRYVDDIVTVNEEAIVAAMRTIWETMKIIIEPSAAVPYASIVEHKIDIGGKRVGIILTGGNVDLDALPWSPSRTGTI